MDKELAFKRLLILQQREREAFEREHLSSRPSTEITEPRDFISVLEDQRPVIRAGSSRTSESRSSFSSKRDSFGSRNSIDNDQIEVAISQGSLPSSYRTRLCKYYAARVPCAHGERCQFAHGVNELRVDAAIQLMCLPPGFKTRLCNNHVDRGKCPHGDCCHFAHGAHELRVEPAIEQGYLPVSYKTQLCNFFATEGVCLQGDRCQQAHGHTELRVEAAIAQAFLPSSFKTRLCTFYLKRGQCPRGDFCQFAHSLGEVRIEKYIEVEKSELLYQLQINGCLQPGELLMGPVLPADIEPLMTSPTAPLLTPQVQSIPLPRPSRLSRSSIEIERQSPSMLNNFQGSHPHHSYPIIPQVHPVTQLSQATLNPQSLAGNPTMNSGCQMNPGPQMVSFPHVGMQLPQCSSSQLATQMMLHNHSQYVMQHSSQPAAPPQLPSMHHQPMWSPMYAPQQTRPSIDQRWNSLDPSALRRLDQHDNAGLEPHPSLSSNCEITGTTADLTRCLSELSFGKSSSPTGTAEWQASASCTNLDASTSAIGLQGAPQMWAHHVRPSQERNLDISSLPTKDEQQYQTFNLSNSIWAAQNIEEQRATSVSVNSFPLGFEETAQTDSKTPSPILAPSNHPITSDRRSPTSSVPTFFSIEASQLYSSEMRR